MGTSAEAVLPSTAPPAVSGPPAACSSASPGLGSASPGGDAPDGIDIAALLRIGPASEAADRAREAREASGKKGDWARHAHETLGILAAGGYSAPSGSSWVDVRAALQKAVSGSVHYSEAAWRPADLPERAFRGSELIEVWNCTVLSATQDLAQAASPEQPPGALNFASARNPGGGFTTGAAAQEESIARSSGLYPCLTKHFEGFFVPARRAESGACTHDMIHSPRVPVLRDDGGQLLEQPYAVDFVTAAAPNIGVLRQKSKGKEAEQLAEGALRERIPRVLDLFARHSARDLVLGAWGCGVFGNDPRTVASLFLQELGGCFRGRFRRVIFAVLDAKMARDFSEVFGTDVVPPATATSQWGAQQRWCSGQGKKGQATM